VDTTAPIISLIGASTITVELDSPYLEPGTTVQDDADSTVTVSNDSVTSVNTALLGTYIVSYNATDASGNVANQITRTVQVVDNTIPSVILNGPSAIYLLNSVAIDTIDPGVTADDASGISSITTNSSNLNTTIDTPANSPLILIYSVTDNNGNVNDLTTREIHVVSTPSQADSDGDLVSDEIEVNFGSNPTVANPVVSVLDINATGDNSGSNWLNARTDITSPVFGSSDPMEPSYLLIAENNLLNQSASITNCNNLVVIGSMLIDNNPNKPATRIASNTLPNSGFEFDPIADLSAFDLSACANVSLADIKISGATGSKVTNSGGGINIDNGSSVNLINVWVTGNNAELFGGGINIEGTSTRVDIVDSLISNNSVNSNSVVFKQGGGIRVGDGAKLSISNTEINDNLLRSENPNSALAGAGISISDLDTEVAISNSLIQGNTLISRADNVSRGGGIALRNNAKLQISNSRVLNNTTSGFNTLVNVSGGGIFTDSATLVIDSSTIAGNNALGSGGGIDENNSSTMDIKNSNINGNSARDAGGAISLNNASLSAINIVNNLIVGNKAQAGGGISQTDVSGTRISNNTFAFNESLSSGGAFFVNNSDLNFFNNTLYQFNNKCNFSYCRSCFLPSSRYTGSFY